MNPYAFQGAPMALPSGQRVFPTCAPFNPSQHWTTPVQDRVSLADVRWMVEASTGMVPLVVSLRQGQQSGDTLAFPLPGGPSAKVSPDSIDAVCAAVEALAPRPVVVHCLHGRNRTLLVLAALALRADKVATVDGALALVRRVRPPGIERDNAVLALRRWWLAKKKGRAHQMVSTRTTKKKDNESTVSGYTIPEVRKSLEYVRTRWAERQEGTFLLTDGVSEVDTVFTFGLRFMLAHHRRRHQRRAAAKKG